MQFGQLQIYRPDGPVENMVLEGESVGIGRSPGNALVLDRNGVSRYHVTLSPRNGEVYIEDLDSVNGTYVDGLAIPAHEPRLLRGGEEIQIADVRLIYQPAVDLDVTVKTSTQTLALDDVRLELEGPDMAVTPGTHVAALVVIENLKTETLPLTIDVSGIPDTWARPDRRELEVPPGETREVRINFKPRRHSESRPGEYEFTVHITEQTTPEHVHEIKSILHVLPYSGYGVALAASTIEAGQPFQLFVHNQGNAPLALDFRGESPSGNLQFEVKPRSVTLGPGERRTITGRVTPRDRLLIGRRREHRFDVISRSRDAAGFQAPISGKLIEQAAIPQWALAAGGIILAAGLVALLAFVLFLLPDDDSSPTPVPPIEINRFALSTAETDINTPLTVSWDTSGAELVSLIVRHELLGEETYALPDTSGAGYELTIPSAGRYDIILEAKNRQRDEQASQVVFVRPGLELIISPPDFDAQPDAGQSNGNPLIVYRNLQQTLTISWAVSWSQVSGDPRPAPTVILDSPPLGYDQQMVPLESPPQSITVLPTSLETIEVVLLSNGPDNIQADLQREINVVDPVCSTTQPATDIFGGPATEGYPLLAAVEPMTLRVNSRIPDGDWVRVYLPPGTNLQREMGWVQASDLDCVFDIEALLETEDFPPPRQPSDPTSTPSPPPPSPTPTPSGTSLPPQG